MNIKIEKKPKKRSEQERSQLTKSKILDAALSEFASSGFEGVSTRMIAGRAGVNHTLISHHFGNKEALWKATAEWVFEDYNQLSIERQKALRGVEPHAMMHALLRNFIEFGAKKPDFHRFMMQANLSDSNRLSWLVDRFLRSGAEAELLIFQHAQDLGLMPKGDSLHIRYLFIGAATSIFTFAPEFALLSGTDPFSDDLIERHVNYMITLFCDNEYL